MYFILSRNAHIQINSSIVHRQSQVVHASPYNSPYKFMSVLINSIQLTGPTAAAVAMAAEGHDNIANWGAAGWISDGCGRVGWEEQLERMTPGSGRGESKERRG